MIFVAIRMLTADSAKYLALIFAIGFSSFLIAHQSSIFWSLMDRTASQITDVSDAKIWVMDRSTQYVDEIKPLPDDALTAVRGAPGVKWAVPYYKGLPRAKTSDGRYRLVILLGVDDATLIGAPRKMVLGSVEDLRQPDAVVVDRAGFESLFPNERYRLGDILEFNDRRAKIVGISDAGAPFQTFPVFYTRYSTARTFQGPERNLMSLILAEPENGVDRNEVCTAIERSTGYRALTGESFANETILYYMKNTGIPVNFGITVLTAILVGAVVSAQTLYLFVLENLKHFGALKAIGVRTPVIAGMVFLQSMIVGAIGYAFGCAMCAGFFMATKDVTHLRGFVTRFEILGGTAAIVFLIILFAGFFSVRRVATLEPATVFRG